MSLDELIATRPFTCQATRSGLVRISFNGRVVTTLSGRQATQFLTRLDAGDSDNEQLVMARATGHFKHGNERASKNAARRK